MSRYEQSEEESSYDSGTGTSPDLDGSSSYDRDDNDDDDDDDDETASDSSRDTAQHTLEHYFARDRRPDDGGGGDATLRPLSHHMMRSSLVRAAPPKPRVSRKIATRKSSEHPFTGPKGTEMRKVYAFSPTRGKKKNVTFLNHAFQPRRLVNRGRVREPRRKIPAFKRAKVSKWSQLKSIEYLHAYIAKHGRHYGYLPFLQKRFKNVPETSPLAAIGRVKARTLRKWLSGGKDCPRYRKLRDVSEVLPLSRMRNQIRWWADPLKESLGGLPVLESVLVATRKLAASSYRWRSMSWLQNEGKRILSDAVMVRLLDSLLTPRERWAWHTKAAVCSRYLIHKIKVVVGR